MFKVSAHGKHINIIRSCSKDDALFKEEVESILTAVYLYYKYTVISNGIEKNEDEMWHNVIRGIKDIPVSEIKKIIVENEAI